MTTDPLREVGVGALLLWLVGRRRRVRVAGPSMAPALREGDQVLVDPRAYRRAAPRPADIVLVDHPFKRGVRLVKRVARVHGDGRVEVRGDEPAHSTDSRTFGALDRAAVRGRVTHRFA